MIYDSHIHIYPEKYNGKIASPEEFLSKCRTAGIGGGSIFSLPPSGSLEYYDEEQPDNCQRIQQVLDYCAQLPDTFLPFYHINPTEPDAPEQVKYAAEHGIRGFKVLCSDYYPEEGLKTYAKCAEYNLPVTFHSGILWDGKVSSGFNRPISFECLLTVPGLRFALAHMSWPWIDECIALVGKFVSAQNCYGNAPQIFVDMSPGAPEYERENAFRKMGFLDYEMEKRLMFGTDNSVNQFSVQHAIEILEFDREKFEHLHEIYSQPGNLRKELRYHLCGRETINYREFFRRATEENYLSFIKR